MKARRFTDVDIVSALIARRTGIAVAGLCRAHNISRSTYYRWNARYAGLSLCDLSDVLAVERENKRLKRRCAGPISDNTLVETLLKRTE